MPSTTTAFRIEELFVEVARLRLDLEDHRHQAVLLSKLRDTAWKEQQRQNQMLWGRIKKIENASLTFR